MVSTPLFIVIYIGSLIGGTVGPLPYGKRECARRVVELTRDSDPAELASKNIKFVCERHDVRPEISWEPKP